MQIASDPFRDELGAIVVEGAAEAFAGNGLTLVRCMELALDAPSEQRLRAHGQRLAELTIQRETVQLAQRPGYAAMLVQGQRALLEGMGAGAAHGGHMMTGGMAMARGSAGLVGSGGSGRDFMSSLWVRRSRSPRSRGRPEIVAYTERTAVDQCGRGVPSR